MSAAQDEKRERFVNLVETHREIERLSALDEIELDLEVGAAAERLDMKTSQLRAHVKKERLRRRRAAKEAENDAARLDAAAEHRPAALPETAKEHFQILGHDHGTWYFLPANGGQVLGIKADKLMSAGTLLQLAPLQWWQDIFPNGNGGMALHHVVDCLIQASYKTGVFDPSRIRGRGVWSDSGRAVAHLGDRLVVDGGDVALTASGDGNIYERGRKLEVSLDRSLTNKEGKAFIELCQSLNWKNRIQSGAFLAGGVAVGSVCGGLAWRPHVWITGEAGVGKSWVVENVVQPALAPLALMVQGQTSEAGIRSALRSDALAVVFEEAEPKTAQERERIQGVLNLARQGECPEIGGVRRGAI